MFNLLPDKPVVKELVEGRSKRYIIAGNPIAWKRAGVQGKRFYDQQIHEKLAWRISIESQLYDKSFFTGPLHIDFLFYFTMPKHASKKKKLSLQSYPHIFKPDTDNLIKFVTDAITGLLIEDDCSISSLSAKKLYDEKPRTEFIITELR